MRKKIIKKTFICLAILVVMFLVSCNVKEPTGSKEETNQTIDQSEYCIVTFDSKGGTDIESIEVKKGEKVSKPKNPTREGFTFLGWYFGDDEWSFIGYVVTEDMTLIAKWKEDSPNGDDKKVYYKVTFDSNGGSYIGDVQVEEGKNVNKPSDPIKENYLFLGWYFNDEIWNFNTNIVENDITLVAKWEKTKNEDIVTVVFDSNGGTMVSSINVEKGSKVTKPGNPTRSGYKFIGWFLENDEWSFIGYTVTEDISLIAKWESLLEIENNVLLGIGSYNDECLVIPENVVEIGAKAFYNCKSIKSIVLHDNVKKINKEAFCGCENISEIIFTSSVTEVTYDAFQNCKNIDKVYFEGELSECVEYGILGKSRLTYYAKNIYILDANGDITFNGNNFKLIADELIIPIEITKIADYAFYGYNKITSLVISDKVESIGDNAFYSCQNLTKVKFGQNVKSIGEYVFYNCKKMNDIDLAKSVVDIGRYAFSNCSFTQIELPENLLEIGEAAFSNCTYLSSLVLPKTVNLINGSAFKYCSNLKDLYYNGNIEDWCNISFGGVEAHPMNYARSFYILDINGDINYLNKKYSLLCGELVIPNVVKKINTYAFYNFKDLTNIIIPDTVTNISSYAFYKCDNLEKMTIPFVGSKMNDESNHYFPFIFGAITPGSRYTYVPSKLKEVTILGGIISEDAFEECKMETIIIGDNVTFIENNAFYNCLSLKNVYIGDFVKEIGEDAFRDCKNLETILIGKSVNKIVYGAFTNCSNLKVVYYKGDFNSWLKIMFYGNYSNPNYYAKNLYILDSNGTVEVNGNIFSPISDNLVIFKDITYIRSVNFTGIENTENLYYDGTISEWCKITFDVNYNNTIVDFAKNIYFLDLNGDITYNGNKYFKINETLIIDNVDEIEDKAFFGFNFKTLIIGDNVIRIGKEAFMDCKNLERVIIGNSVTNIYSYAFYGCSNLVDIVIGSSVKKIFNNVFSDCEKIKRIYYYGDKWENINIDYLNGQFNKATIYYYSEIKPETSGRYWYYNDNDEIVIW